MTGPPAVVLNSDDEDSLCGASIASSTPSEALGPGGVPLRIMALDAARTVARLENGENTDISEESSDGSTTMTGTESAATEGGLSASQLAHDERLRRIGAGLGTE